MKNTFDNVTRKISMFGLKCKKHSPEILAVGGTVCVVAGTVMACKATLKINDVLEESKETLEESKKTVEKINGVLEGTIDIPADAEYTEQDAKKDLAVVYTQTYARIGVKIAKIYLPAVIVTGTGLAMLLGSNHILRERNAALGAALVTTTQLFKEYRGRVVESFGERTDFELRHNIRAEEIDMEVVNEDGSVETVKKTVDVKQSEIDAYSEFARCFDVGNPYWRKSAIYNKDFLLMRQNEANKLLKAKGYLFLNDVYEMIGFEETKAGQVMGWIYDKDNPIGDNQISFGIFDADKPSNEDFVNGLERSIWLDFNIDGNIYDLVW